MDVVDFIGFTQDVKTLMGKARALIVASRFEGFGRMTAEAAFCGCLVIGHNAGDTKEILDITGGFPYGTYKELEKKMETVATLPDNKYRKMAIYSQEQAVEKFSIESNVNQIIT